MRKNNQDVINLVSNCPKYLISATIPAKYASREVFLKKINKGHVFLPFFSFYWNTHSENAYLLNDKSEYVFL